MADTVSTRVVSNGTVEYVVQLISRSDGTGESGAIKVDKSTLAGPNGLEPTYVAVTGIEYDISGMQVDLFWDHTSDVKIAAIGPGYGEICFERWGSIKDTGTGGTGDIILTTTGHTAGDGYNIILKCKLVE